MERRQRSDDQSVGEWLTLLCPSERPRLTQPTHAALLFTASPAHVCIDAQAWEEADLEAPSSPSPADLPAPAASRPISARSAARRTRCPLVSHSHRNVSAGMMLLMQSHASGAFLCVADWHCADR